MSLQRVMPTKGLVANWTPGHFVSVNIVSLSSFKPSYAISSLYAI